MQTQDMSIVKINVEIYDVVWSTSISADSSSRAIAFSGTELATCYTRSQTESFKMGICKLSIADG